MALTRGRFPGFSSAETGMLLALMAPFLSPWLWPALAFGLGWTCSCLAILATLAGFVVLYPPFALVAIPFVLLIAFVWWTGPKVGGSRLFELTPRGDSLDSIVGRLTALQLAAFRLTWRGHGIGSAARDLRRWTSRGTAFLPLDSFLCDPLQVVYEFGAAGAFVLALALGLFLHAFEWGSPWSAAGVSFGVLSLGHSPARLLANWVRRRIAVLLPDPPLVAEVTIHVAHNGTFRIYVHGMLAREIPPEQAATIASAVVRAGIYWAEGRGLALEQFGDFQRL